MHIHRESIQLRKLIKIAQILLWGLATYIASYLLSIYKIHCFITLTNHIARKFTLVLPIPYMGIYLMLIKRIHTSFITEINDSYLLSE